MSSIYLVRRGELWLHVWEQESEFLPFVAGAACYATRKDAEVAASLFTGAEPVEFREVPKDAAAIAVVRHVRRVAPLPLDELGESIAESIAKDGLTESDLIGGES